MANPHDEALAAAIRERDALMRKSEAIAARAAKLTALKSEHADAQRAVDELATRETEALSEWALNGAEGTPPRADARTREAAERRLTNAANTARAIDGALAELQAEQLAVANEMRGVQQKILSVRARLYAQLWSSETARLREIEDEKAIVEATAARAYREAFTVPEVASPIASELESLRLAWLAVRTDAIQKGAAARWAQVASALPA